jgi:hypothetical protein
MASDSPKFGGWNWWHCPRNGRQEHHLVPENDDREHLREGFKCWCKPEDGNAHNEYVHNAADGRERYEDGYRKPH